MRDLRGIAAACLGVGLSLVITSCGGSSTQPPPPPTTYTLTVNSANPGSGVAIGVSPADNNSATNGTTSFTRTYNAGTSVTLIAPATSNGNNFSSWTGCTSATTVTCTVTLNANTTVTANYATPTIVTPTVTVTPTLSIVDVNRPDPVTIAVSGPAGYPTPTGSVVLVGSSVTNPYTSAAAALTNGSASITIPVASLTVGYNTLTASYSPDAAASSTYDSASGIASVFLNAPAVYALTVESSNPAGGVTIGVTPADRNNLTNGSTSFMLSYLAGTSVTLTAPATSNGNNFTSWTGCTSTSGTTCNVTLTANTTVTANYTPTYVITVNSTNPASGVPIEVSSCDNNVCPLFVVSLDTSFTLNEASGVVYTLIAPATAGGNTFSSWTGCDTASGPACTVTSVSANRTVTVNYATPITYTLTVNSTNPSSGVMINYNNPLNNVIIPGVTSFTVTEPAGTTLNLTAPATTAGGNTFSSWSGCTTASTLICNVTLNADTTVTASYTTPPVAVLPNPVTVTIGVTQQFRAEVNGTTSSAVTWSVAAPGSSLSPGAISASGLYITPYPAPATVTVTAVSTQNTANSGSVVVTLSPPITAAGPALTVDTTNQTHSISPDIYGMDAYLFHATAADAAAVAKANIPVDRWGGDSTERYNYQLDVTSSIDDWFFENGGGNGGDGWPSVNGATAFDNLVESNNSSGIKTLGTVPVLGWVAKDSTSCSFPKSSYPDQLAVNSKPAFSTDGRNCGSGIYPNGVAGCTNSSGCNIPSDPTVTSIAEPPPALPAASAVNATWADAAWAGEWTEYLVNKFGSGNSGTGVAIYDLDNEPTWWDAEDVDVHPLPFTYDEVTNGGIGTALAIKTVDPTAEVSGPVIDYWWAYFYSKKDIESGWDSGSPCYEPWSNPVDRAAHNGVPFIQYYLSQFAQAQTTYGVRLLDYVDLHTYFAATYNGSGVGLTTAGDTGEQEARINSTRAFWDSTYTDPNYAQPNYSTDANYYNPSTHGNCNIPLQAPQLIPMMQSWVNDPTYGYPGTKLAIDEYNFGGLEAVNGAVTQADILGIFGREGLDLGAFWPTQDPSTQIPGMMAFAIYRNYDGNDSTFGNMALASTTADQGKLSVYSALRTADNTLTVVVINKTYGGLTSTLSLAGLPSAVTGGQAYLYSNANLNAIVAQPAVTVTPGQGGAAGTIANYIFPAQSITLFVVPM